MATPLDRIRTQAGLTSPRPAPGSGTARSPASAAPATAQRTTQRPAGDVQALVRARHGSAVDLTGLRAAAIATGVLAMIVATTHRWFLGWVAGRVADGGLFVFDWMLAVLTFWQVDRWGPFVAATVAFGVLVLAVTTDGFERGHAAQSVSTSIAIGVGTTLSIPFLIAAVLGVLTMVAYAVFAIAMVAAAGMVLWALAAAAFE